MARPVKRFHEFIGQQPVVEHVQRLIHGAKVCGEACTSLLLVGTAGSGKTSIAKAVAAEYGSDFQTLLAGSDTKPAEICELLREVRHGDVVLIDEAHALGSDAQQILYLALDEWRVPTANGRGVCRSDCESIAKFTLILATNEPGRLKLALRSRLTRIEFAPYTLAELKEIAQSIAQVGGIEISPQAANLLAQVAHGSPRSIARRLANLRHYFPGVTLLSKDHVRTFLASEGLDDDGLSRHQRQYLQHLGQLGDGYGNIERLAIKLGCDAANVRQEIEPLLVERGLVDPTSRRGRRLTDAGRAWIDGQESTASATQEAQS